MTLWCAKNTFLGGYNTRILLPPILLKTHVKLLCRSFFINTNRGVQVWPAQTVWAKSKTVWPDVSDGWWQVSTSRNRNRQVDLRVFTWKIESNRPPLQNLAVHHPPLLSQMRIEWVLSRSGKISMRSSETLMKSFEIWPNLNQIRP